MKALICGAGIGGLALAWHLERSGWDVELLERAPAFREGGYMIDFFGPGFEVAERMGLGPKLREARYPFVGLDYLDRNGKRTSSLDMRENFAEVVSLLRGDLARIIHDDVTSPIRYGTSIDAIEESGDRVTATLADGSQREVDLLVGADGTHSRVRELVFGPEERFLRSLGHHVAAFVAADEELSSRVGQRFQLLNVPEHLAAAYSLRGGRIATMFLLKETAPGMPDDPVETLRQHYDGLGWIVPDLLRRCPRPPELYYDEVTQVEMDQWSRGRVVLLGDACQAVSLFAGHGASMAVSAAWMLDDELRAAGDDVTGALARYQERMQPTIADTQRLGRKMVQWMAPATQLRITARDWIMRAASLPVVNRVLLKSLSPGTHSLVSSSAAEAWGKTQKSHT